MKEEWNLADVRAALKEGHRVLLMVRHAERPKMDKNDPTFGMEIPLTQAGEKMSLDFGVAFRDFAHVTQFYASPLKRTRLTAKFIAQGMGLPNAEIPTAPILGNETPYFADAYRVFEIFRDCDFFESVCAYVAAGTFEGFNEIHAATEALETWCLANFTGKLGIFTTHDLYNVAFLSAKGAGPHFTRETWTRFLDSAAIIVHPDGSRDYALVRAGLSEGICGVGSTGDN